MKIRQFKIGKKKQYYGISIKLGWLKLERIGLKRKYFLWRIELSNWSDN